ncbi:Eco57I restriction-modification methylase domain-containing protein [Lyngbya sp. PCC 8106]|uniref:Eco57I restriction-modification methylase domain-containing protein n=1 Tax=Lyngbya sp. (strain PCC 8106) TaxID=313612 RepID=UPI0000EA9F57|nr:N-6 DNA methylase [Lyngbya sp. PCC 8106]EAW36783.1 hypothetical protein L8106_30065 [Lyngbya sp. PCC 8106]
MALEILEHNSFTGPAFPEPFVKFELEKQLTKKKLLAKTTGTEGKTLQQSWEVYRRKLRELSTMGGAVRVFNHVVEPLIERLGYATAENADQVQTREGLESGGYLLKTADGSSKLRVWTTAFEEDLDAPAKRGLAYRFSHLRVAQRVLLTSGERVGLLTNGVELRVLISDPARPDSQLIVPIDTHWKRSRSVPDSYRLVWALSSPEGIVAVPELVEKARLQQAQVTKDLRVQARRAVRLFIQEILDRGQLEANAEPLTPDIQNAPHRNYEPDALAKQLWREGLIVVYRLLFVLKLETSDDPARAFSFASTSLWRNSFSPTTALAKYVRRVLDEGMETGEFLEQGLKQMFRMFAEGLECTELHVKPLGGALFGPNTTPILSSLSWGERAVAHLLDQLLWTAKRRGAIARERVHYGSLDVEDLGRVYEALLELEPGIATEPMCRLQRDKLQVVVPLAQGEKYRPVVQSETDGDTDIENDDEEETPKRTKKTKVQWIEEIKPGQFYLRVGLGRKSSGSYYTPHSFVRFLVRETLGAKIDECSPKHDPNPSAILKLKVLDPAMGSGHFLVEACRFLGDQLYEACRLCDEKILAAEQASEAVDPATPNSDSNAIGSATDAAASIADVYRQRILALPDPEKKLLNYLPSSAPEGQESGYSQQEAQALCRRMVAVHCLYGVDKNPLAVELAKLSLWLESHAEGLPLTFLDHRLLLGDSLTGPFFHHLLTYPGTQQEIDPLLFRGIRERFTEAMAQALTHVKSLEATVGFNLSELKAKEAAKDKLDRALAPFKIIAAAWSGGVMLGNCDDIAYANLVKFFAENGELPEDFSALETSDPVSLRQAIAKGLGVGDEVSGVGCRVSGVGDEVSGVGCRVSGDLSAFLTDISIPAFPYDLMFAEVFYPTGNLNEVHGFDVVLGNPPWDRVRPFTKEFLASFDISILDAPNKRESEETENRLLNDPKIKTAFEDYQKEFEEQGKVHDVKFQYQNVRIGNILAGRGNADAYCIFAEASASLLKANGYVGLILPSGFHANEGATGIRQLYFENMACQCCYSFENRRKLFEIDSRFKFATVIAQKGKQTTKFPCAFYLHDDEWLFEEKEQRPPLNYTLDFIQKTGGDYLSLLELQSEKDLEVAKVCFATGEPFGTVCERLKIKLGRELDMNRDDWRFTNTDEILPNGEDPRDPDIAKQLLERGYLVLHEGKTFWLYNDRWEDKASSCIEISRLQDKPDWCQASTYFRGAYRAIASSTNERTIVFLVLPPGSVFGNSAPVERQPFNCSRNFILQLSATLNTFSFDWTARIRASANINQFILFSCPLPIQVFADTRHQNPTPKPDTFLAHSALRLTCNHSGYEPLWREQLGDVWRENSGLEDENSTVKFPVLATDDERWKVRAAIDAVIAQAYHLNREQYCHVLSTFSHKSYPKAPQLCLEMFDELESIGLEAFTQKYDPYHDIPLNENLPKPVISLPIPETNSATTDDGFQLTSPPVKEKSTKRRRKK